MKTVRFQRHFNVCPDTTSSRIKQRITSSAVPKLSWKSYQDVSQQKFEDQSQNLHVQFVHERIGQKEQLERAKGFQQLMDMRRSVRFFSQDNVSIEVIKECIATAGSAPSGAHLQPWTFMVVQDAEVKLQIRKAVEQAEKENYQAKMSGQWLKDVKSMISHLHKTDVQKPYLTEAPYIIVLLEHKYQFDSTTGEKNPTYYSSESCGIAAGILIAAIQNANLVTLTSTTLGAGDKLRNILKRPQNERVFLLLPVGYPADNCTVPYRAGDDLRKPLQEIMKLV
eukprot:TRINITY_DN9743_c0_g3_i2.p1 TRINITY_DN9743_c0_g3~~TRINITY_DN9743_c0_g3_i2.p1  ORF type:complete len:281 (+),score=19.95 TRINITY_DN9743_c0_g3_i2:155-997(+)